MKTAHLSERSGEPVAGERPRPRSSARKCRFAIVLMFGMLLLPVLTMAGELQFTVDDTIHTDNGYFLLEWDADSASVELQQIRGDDYENARTLYIGPDEASFISGLPNGVFRYRIRLYNEETGEAGEWVKPVVAVVDHHSLTLAFILFGLGAVVFGLTCVVVIAGSRKTRNDIP